MSPESIAQLRLGSRDSEVVSYPTLSDVCGPLAGPDGDRPIDLIIADQNTRSLIPADVEAHCVVVPAGERAKEIDVLTSVLEAVVRAGLSRDSVIAGFGGGAVTDLAAFVGSVYLRGIDVVLIPTTLLAMVDAAIGGKTGIDFAGYKNIVGTFAPAREIRITTDVLGSLSEREFRSGMAEVIKAGLLGDADLVDLLERRRGAILEREDAVIREVISRAVRVKARVVQDDFTESGTRAHLNLGHTFGHALEAVLGLGRVTHGEAVAWGIARAAAAAEHERIASAPWLDRTRALLNAYGYDTGPVPDGVSTAELLAAMHYDKKRRRDGIRFVLQTGPQQTVLRKLAPQALSDILSTTRGQT